MRSVQWSGCCFQQKDDKVEKIFYTKCSLRERSSDDEKTVASQQDTAFFE